MLLLIHLRFEVGQQFGYSNLNYLKPQEYLQKKP